MNNQNEQYKVICGPGRVWYVIKEHHIDHFASIMMDCEAYKNRMIPVLYQKERAGDFKTAIELCNRKNGIVKEDPPKEAQNGLIPVVAVQDYDCHWYVIPQKLSEEFNELLEKSGDASLLPAEKDAAEDQFIEIFSQYMTGGDLNNIQLYAATGDAYGESLMPRIKETPPLGPMVDPEQVKANVMAMAGIPYPEGTSEGMAGGAIAKLMCGVSVSDKERQSIHIFMANQGTGKPPIEPGQLSRDEMGRITYPQLDEFAKPTVQPYVDITKQMIDKAFGKDKSALEMVEEFHQAFNCPVYITPSLPSYNGAYSETMEKLFNELSDYMKGLYIKDSRTLLRMKLIFEEYKELCEAMRDGDFAHILKELCDLLYTVYGTAHEFGLGPILKQAFAEVHRSNMSKLNGDDAPIVRNDGKVLKGPNYTPPDLTSILSQFNSAWNGKQWGRLPESMAYLNPTIKGFKDGTEICTCKTCKSKLEESEREMTLGKWAGYDREIPENRICGEPEHPDVKMVMDDVRGRIDGVNEAERLAHPEKYRPKDGE